jgi:hypothetical protein
LSEGGGPETLLELIKAANVKQVIWATAGDAASRTAPIMEMTSMTNPQLTVA